MKLLKVRIENYRSIDALDIDIIHGCQALIGINESGKSNILRALQLLDPSAEVGAGDLRIERTNEPQVNEGSVAFDFQLEGMELKELVDAVVANVDPGSVDKPIVTGANGMLSISEFCRERAIGVYQIDLPSAKRAPNYWALPKSFKVAPGWLKNKGDSTITLRNGDGGTDAVVPPKGFFKDEGIDLATSPPALASLTIEDVSVMVGLAVRKIIAANLPKCVFWKYSEQYLLPSSIDVNVFAQNPDACVPLRSMFELAGYAAGDLAKTIASAKSQSLHRYTQLLRKVADAATEHIRKVWTDHKSIRIELQPNGELLVPLISEAHVPLDMVSRSDGFKRFVSFLLQVSAKVRTNELRNILLLIDEPEIALHPGGARSLMKELIEIGESNTVVYSTHSIFMVDRTTIDRHLIVEKVDEATTARRAEKSRILDEEVLYAAMGYSIFESLRERNLIFEGWRDKEIFRIVCESMGKADKALKAKLADIGLTFAEGVKDVKHIARFLQLASRGCLVISDSDAAAIQKRREYEKPGSWGKWVTLQDILGARIAASTAEDLILREAVIKRANRFRSSIQELAPLEGDFFGATEPTLPALKRWIRTAGIEGDALDGALDDLKLALFEKLKRDEISDAAEALVAYVRDYAFEAK